MSTIIWKARKFGMRTKKILLIQKEVIWNTFEYAGLAGSCDFQFFSFGAGMTGKRSGWLQFYPALDSISASINRKSNMYDPKF